MLQERNEEYTVGTTAVRIADTLNAVQGERIIIFIENNSTAGQNIRVTFGSQATTSKGIKLAPGGSITMQKEAFVPITQSFIFAISDAASGTVSVYERIDSK